MTLFSRGKGSRTVIASYVIECPVHSRNLSLSSSFALSAVKVWKTSYRLQLALAAQKAAAGAFFRSLVNPHSSSLCLSKRSCSCSCSAGCVAFQRKARVYQEPRLVVGRAQAVRHRSPTLATRSTCCCSHRLHMALLGSSATSAPRLVRFYAGKLEISEICAGARDLLAI